LDVKPLDFEGCEEACTADNLQFFYRSKVCNVQYSTVLTTTHRISSYLYIFSIAQYLKIPKLNTTLRKPGPFSLLVYHVGKAASELGSNRQG